MSSNAWNEYSDSQFRTVPTSQPVLDDDFAEDAGTWSSFRDIPPWAWGVSLGAHLLVLMLFASITLTTFIDRDTIISSAIEEIDPESYKFDATVVDTVGNDSSVNSLSPSQSAATHVSKTPQEEIDKQLEEELLTVNTPQTDAIPQPNEQELLEKVDTTGATEHPGGVEGALDRLTMEIASSLKERKTLVVWLFDASLSLNDRREEIANRFENVYKQLDSLDVGADRALKTAVVRYGLKTDLITQDPVDDVRDVVNAVRAIEPDESGVENVFTALSTVTQRWLSYRTKMRRNMMVIIVTDERGDDPEKLEEIINQYKRYGIKVYCVGHAAPFGRDIGYLTWKYDDGYTEELPMDQGPETVAPERLRLPFWGSSSRDLDRMSSGYGPYALTRLCAETGGLYLVTDDNNRGPRFEPAVMRNYPPDYRPIRAYQQELQKNLAKGSLVRAATATQVTNMPQPQLTFRADSDNILRQQAAEAQRPLAELDYYLNEMLQILSMGEKDRDKLDSPRWKASFDLAMGRVLAMRVRAYGYNSVLAEMRSSPRTFSEEGNNTWRLVPSQEILAGPQVKKLALKAEEYLTRVIDDHPGTPWAMLAERELGQPMGWEWEESRVLYPGTEPRNDEERARLLLAEEENRRRMQNKDNGPKRDRPKL